MHINSPYYLVWDADSIPLRRLEFFKDSKVLFEKSAEFHKPYFDTLEALNLKVRDSTLKKVAPFSFISENMMIDSYKMCELLELIEQTHKKPFYKAILDCINPSDLGHSGFSEFESYGNFIAMKYPDSFEIITRKRDRFAKEFLGVNPCNAMLEWYARSYEVCGIESWDKKNDIITSILSSKFARILPPRFYKRLFRVLKMR